MNRWKKLLTLQVLSMEPVTMREQSQLNWTLLISPLWPINVWTRLRENREQHQVSCALVCRIYNRHAHVVRCKWWNVQTGHTQMHSDDASPSWRHVPYGDRVVEGAGDELISHRVKAQREDLCSVTLDGIKGRALFLIVSLPLFIPLPLRVKIHITTRKGKCIHWGADHLVLKS